jgi:hypothetical protein
MQFRQEDTAVSPLPCQEVSLGLRKRNGPDSLGRKSGTEPRVGT